MLININSSIHSLVTSIDHKLKPYFNSQNKKIALIALAVFATLTICYGVFRLIKRWKVKQQVTFSTINSPNSGKIEQATYHRPHPNLSIGDSILKDIKANPRLEIIEITNSDITDQGIEFLVQTLPKMKKVHLKNCPQITDKSLKYLGELSHLNSLSLSYCNNITDRGLKYFSEGLHDRQLSLGPLKSLNLEGCDKITDNALSYFRSFGFLEHLNLNQCRQITDRGLQQLASSSLTSLNLSGCPHLTDDGLINIAASLFNLTHLDLSNCCITDRSFLAINKLEKLSHLNLNGCIRITDNAFANRRNLKLLKSLDIRGTSCQSAWI